MAETSAWMPLYIGDYLADTGHLGVAEHGAYLMLLMHYWRTGPLPDDDRALARIARADRKEWDAVAPTVRQFFTERDGKLHQKRIDQERQRVLAVVDQKRAAGKASAEQRARRRKDDESSADDEIPLQRIGRELQPQPELHSEAASQQQPRASLHPANGAGPSPKWDDAAIEPEPTDHRPCVNGFYLDFTFNEALEAANMDPVRSRATWKPVIAWLKDGIEPSTILAAIHRCAERSGYEPPKSLAYFDRPVREEKPH